jgi:anthranilate synthase component 1
MRLRQHPDKAQFLESAKTANVIPVYLETLADLDTPVSILAKITPNRSPVFLFESVEGGERWGRYSFMGASAHFQIRVYQDRIAVQRDDQTVTQPHPGSPFEQLKAFMADYRPARVAGLPRFWGGLVGNLSYEAVSFIEHIPHRLDKQTPLAHFFMPDELLIFDNVRNTLQLVAIAYLNNGENASDEYGRCLQRLEHLNRQVNAPTVLPESEALPEKLEIEAQVSPAAFRERVTRVKQYIRAGDIIQAVISQPFVCPAAVDPITLYRAQRYVNPSPYMFFLHLDDIILVGSSPETMVRLENRVATLRPIAGTRPRGESEQADRALADDLLKDEKERAEHLMLVDLGRNDLGRVAQTGSVQVTDLMVIERYSHVMHLVSNIVCDLKPDCDAWDLLAATFPAGTLSGAPKIRAMEIIAEMEQTPRKAYGGAVGYISFDGNMDMAITIRTACIEKSGLSVRAGAGIVADSDPETERMETVNKAKAIGQALRIVAQGGRG